MFQKVKLSLKLLFPAPTFQQKYFWQVLADMTLYIGFIQPFKEIFFTFNFAFLEEYLQKNIYGKLIPRMIMQENYETFN